MIELPGRRRRGWPRALSVLALAGAVAGLIAVGVLGRTDSPSRPISEATAARPSRPLAHDTRFRLKPEARPAPVTMRFHLPPRAGVLFDLDTGEVLWHRRETRRLPIASLTKMMTALLISRRHGLDEHVRISPAARHVSGSAMGVLPRRGSVRLNTLLNGLLLVSGNDAAVALAEHDSGRVRNFVAMMNREARRMGLTCTRFNTPHGLLDDGNHSCARDLAELARADMADARIRRIAGRSRYVTNFPIKGGRLFIYSNNPLLRAGWKGILGLKTGYTSKAGRCYVMIARRGGRRLGVVLLHSPDPFRQIKALLRAGAHA